MKLFKIKKAPSSNIPNETETLCLKNKEKFELANKSRLNFLKEQLAEKKLDVFSLLPYLLHEDDKSLPGNEFEVLCGVSCFSFSQELKKLIPKYFPKANTSQRSRNTLPINFLAVMGSAGTIAFTGKSDIDIWVGINLGNHIAKEIDILNCKFKAIEKWAMEQAGLEVHFFITDIKKLKENNYGDLGGESCGSALGKLLKDEFYRTAIFLEGKLPFYWIINSGSVDSDYDAAIKILTESKTFPSPYFVDIGNVSAIDSEELTGAALWQILKGLHSPFKSILKIALLNKYISKDHNGTPLCESYKEKILTGNFVSAPDPYLFLVETVREYYTQTNDEAKLKLIEKSFLLKGLLSSNEELGSNNFYNRIEPIIKEWGWDNEDFLDLINFCDWGPDKREVLRREILTFFISSYKMIRSHVPKNKKFITDKDLNAIGKQLSIFFETKNHKIPFEFSLITNKDISQIFIVKIEGSQKAIQWGIKVRMRGARKREPILIRKFPNLSLVIGWISINQLYHVKQHLEIETGSKLSNSEIIYLINSLTGFFRYKSNSNKINVFDSHDKIVSLYIVPNLFNNNYQYGIISLTIFYQYSTGEMAYEHKQAETVKKWLLEDFILFKIGRPNLRPLNWAIHTTKEKLSRRQQLSEELNNEIANFVAKWG